MTGNCFLDTETCGFHGPTVLIQYSQGNHIELHHVFREETTKTLDLIEEIVESDVIAFNLTFDWFHINHTYNTLKLLKGIPNNWDEYIEAEKESRDGVCLKPAGCLDLMLFAFKGPLQCTMDRRPIKIRKVPNEVAWLLRDYLDAEIQFDDIFFAGKKSKDRWVIQDIKDEPDYKNVVLNFVPLRNLKILTEYAIGRKREKFIDLELPNPLELGYAPYAKAIIDLDVWPGKKTPKQFKGKWKGAWPSVIQQHIERWAFNRRAQQYARMDVQDLIDLYAHFGNPDNNDDDSVLAAMVGATRLKGFAIDTERIHRLIAATPIEDIPLDGKASRDYLYKPMTDLDRMSCNGSTEKKMLEIISGWGTEDSKRADKLIKNRSVRDQLRTYTKILIADRLHASFKIMTKSDRMAGADDLNVQGISNNKEVRQCFTLANSDELLLGGDFHAFEVTIFLAICGPGKLMDEINAGKKIHGLFGTHLFPGKTYEDILESEGTGGLNDLYFRAKRGVFLKFYGGNAWTIAQKVFVEESVAEAANKAFEAEYPEVAKAQQKVIDTYTAIKQPDGIGSKIYWETPKNYTESLMGFKRYFDLEIKVMEKLFALAQDPPAEWLIKDVSVMRRQRVQTTQGATQSALFAAAFSVQGHMQRVATNHPVQSTGAGIIKRIQCKLWELQPVGIHKWLIRMMNIHDELETACDPSVETQTYEIVDKTIKELRKIVPMLSLTWQRGKNWAQTH